MALFDEAARKRIEAAIQAVERTTAGEIVVVSVPRCDPYHDLRLAYGIAFALAGAGIAHVLLPELTISALLWLEAAVVAAAWFAFDLPALLRLMVPAARAEACVQRRAELEFLEHRVYDTRDHTGVLILLSELEHRVVLLGDAGIYERLHAEGFQRHVDRIVAAIRSGHAADGVSEVITDLGRLLAEQFPARTDDRNELPDVVHQDDR